MTQEVDDDKLVADANAMAKRKFGQSFDEMIGDQSEALMDYCDSKTREERMKLCEVLTRHLELRNSLTKEELAEKDEEISQILDDFWRDFRPKK